MSRSRNIASKRRAQGSGGGTLVRQAAAPLIQYFERQQTRQHSDALSLSFFCSHCFFSIERSKRPQQPALATNQCTKCDLVALFGGNLHR
uniref:Uncharacterized protein n=1 Tax=Caenorhabditis japonica TaxID=281687 RepID=A0A8R1EG46_CAEJA